MRYTDRHDAGRHLADHLGHLVGAEPLVVGLPRGGVPVAAPVAAALDAPLTTIVVRKLGVPSQPELAMGAVGPAGIQVLNEDVLAAASVAPHELAKVVAAERAAVEERVGRFGSVTPAELAGRTVVLVDDGAATGATMRAACEVARAAGAGRVVVALPVAPPDVADALRRHCDELVCPVQPSPFRAVGEWYDDFRQTTDDEVLATLAGGV